MRAENGSVAGPCRRMVLPAMVPVVLWVIFWVADNYCLQQTAFALDRASLPGYYWPTAQRNANHMDDIRPSTNLTTVPGSLQPADMGTSYEALVTQRKKILLDGQGTTGVGSTDVPEYVWTVGMSRICGARASTKHWIRAWLAAQPSCGEIIGRP